MEPGMTLLAIHLVIGLIIGLALGLTGGGGSLLAVPLLVYGAQLPLSQATTVSLLTVGLIALWGAAQRLREHSASLRVAIIFAITGMLTAPAGQYLARRLDERWLVLGFLVLAAIIAFFMWKKSSSAPQDSRYIRSSRLSKEELDEASGPACRHNANGKLHINSPCAAVLSLSGAATGLLAGLFGVGGGFLIVPALQAITQLSVYQAVSTSLVVIALIAIAGSGASLLSTNDIAIELTLQIVAGGVLGMILGSLLAKKLAGPKLQRTFAILIVLASASLLYQLWR